MASFKTLRKLSGIDIFGVFSHGNGKDTTTFVGIGVAASILSLGVLAKTPLGQELLEVRISRLQYVAVFSGMAGVLGADWANELMIGGLTAKAKLVNSRKRRWDSLPEEQRLDKYLGGNHLNWLESYRKARDE
jgi:hypothetical protein